MQLLNSLIAGLVCSTLAVPAVVSAQSTAAAAAQPTQATAAATVPTGGTKVHGTVSDPDGDLIPGATVTFTPSKGPGRSVKSGSDGTYTLTVTPGTYTMLVSMPGFASYLTTNLKVPAVASTTLDAKLKIGEETQVVNVEASAVQLSVDPDSNASSTVLQGKDLEALSDDPDELESELSALAGPSAGPNGGQIYVDGFTGGQLPPKSSIREIRINQNPFSAEYDRLGFGRVEVFTKPGTDKFHGSFQMNGNPSQFNTENPLIGSGVVQPPYHTIFMFGSITGPINKNASFSVGGSHRDIEDDALTNAIILAPTSGSLTLCAPGNTSCVLSNAQFSTYTPQVRTDISPRIDLALGEKNVLTMRYQYAQNDQLNSGVANLSLPNQGLNVSSQSNEIQISDTQTWTSKLINESRFEYEREHMRDSPVSGAPAVSVSGTFSSGGNTAQTTSDHQDHYEVQNYTSLQLAKNFIRFGGRMRVDREAQSPAQNTNGSFVYNTLQYSGTGTDNSYATGRPSQFSLTQVNVPALRYTFADLGLYAESDWKARPNLTVSYGIRYETQNHLSDHHDIAPRISFAYGLGSSKGAPKTVLRGGFGLFYDRFSGNYILNLLRYSGANETVYKISQPVNCSPSDTNYKVDCIAGATATAQQTYTRTPDLRTPYITQFAGGFDQQVTRAGSLSVNYLHSQGVHQFATQNIGYPVGVIPGQNLVVKPNYQYFSEGVFRQDQLIVNGRISTGRHVSLFGFYSLNFAKGDTSGAGSQISTPYNIAADYGRTSFDTRNRIFMAGSISLPRYIQFSPFMIAQSGSPYNVTVGQDVNGDTFYNDRPYRVTGVSPNGNNVKTLAGCGTFATADSGVVPAGSSIAPINACTGPSLFTFNFRLTKSWGFGESRSAQNQQQGGEHGHGGGGGGGEHGHGGGGGGRGGPGGGGPGGMFGGGGSSTGKHYNLALGVQVQNLFGNRDLSGPNSTLLSQQFGQQTQLAGGPYTTSAATRRVALQASFNF